MLFNLFKELDSVNEIITQPHVTIDPLKAHYINQIGRLLTIHQFYKKPTATYSNSTMQCFLLVAVAISAVSAADNIVNLASKDPLLTVALFNIFKVLCVKNNDNGYN